MPSFYGATVAVLSATKDRLNLLNQSWEPDRLVDYGSGTGSGAWALHSVWGNAVTTTGRAREYIGLDSSRAMIELSSTMLGALPFSEPTLPPTPFDPVKLTAATHQIPLPASTSALGKLKLSPASSLPITGLRTIAMAAFSLGDLGTKEKRKDIIKAMWASGAEVIVIIDRGTPAGSRIVVEAREQLLMLGKRSMMRDTIEGSVEAERGCYVLTPVRIRAFAFFFLGRRLKVDIPQCPHDGDCPLHHSTRSYCHFSQRGMSLFSFDQRSTCILLLISIYSQCDHRPSCATQNTRLEAKTMRNIPTSSSNEAPALVLLPYSWTKRTKKPN